MVKLIDNRFEIIRKLGEGGTGEVYLARDKLKDKELVIKFLTRSESGEELLHLKKEFLSMTKLTHPNIVKVYDFVLKKENTSYFTMEYVAGDDFVKTIGNLDDKYSCFYSLVAQICRVLEFIHSHGVVHCDIKPSNILVTTGKQSSPFAKVLDFGMVEYVDIISKGMRGTIEYMAPEMIKGMPIDRRADLYSLGVLLYEAVTGKLPFEGTTVLSVLKQHLDKPPVPPSEYKENIPQKLDQIILKLLNKYPYNRYQSAREVISDIVQISGESVTLEPQKGQLLSGCFVGREKELSQLENILNKKTGAVVYINGDTGIGKSRLMEEFRVKAQLNGFGFWKSICREEEGTVYEPMVDILRELVCTVKSKHMNLVREYGDTLAQFIPGLKEKIPGASTGIPAYLPAEQAGKIQLFDSVTQFLVKLSLVEPYVIFIDNICQKNDSIIEFLQYFIRNIGKSKILLCLAFCNDDINKKYKIDESGERILLEKLTRDETNTLVASMLGGHTLSSAHTQWIFEETQGNPLFIQELLKAMVGKTLLFQKGKWVIEENNLGKLGVSKTIRDVLRNRLKGMSNKAYGILKTGSVFNGKFKLNVIRELMNYTDDELFNGIEEILNRQLLREYPDGYSFANPQFREIIYEEIDETARRKLHRSAGEILEKMAGGNVDAVTGELAYHFTRGLDKKKASAFSIIAGKKAKSLYAHRETIKCFEQAVGLIEKKEDEYCSLLKELGDVYVMVGEYDKAIDRYKELLLCNPGTAANTYCDMGVAYRKKGDLNSAIEFYEKGISGARGKNNHQVKARIYQEMSWVYQSKSEYDKALDSAYKGLKIAEKNNNLHEMERIYHNLGTINLRKSKFNESAECFEKSLEIKKQIEDLPGEAASYNNLGVVCSVTGDLDKALQHYRKAFDIYERIKDPAGMARGYKNLGTICYRRSDLAKAREYYEKSLEIEERMGDNAGIAASYNNMGLVYGKQRKWTEAVDFFKRSLEIKEKLGDIQGVAGCYNNLGSVYNSRGNWEEASKCYEKSLSIKEKIGDPLGIANSLVNLGTVYVNKNKNDRAVTYLQRAEKIGNETGNKRVLLDVYRALGGLYLNVKNTGEAIRYNTNALKLASELKSKTDEGIISRKLSEIYQLKEDNVKTEEYLLKSISVLKSTGMEVELAKSYFRLGEFKKIKGDTKDSLIYLKEAQTIFEKLGMEENLKEIKNLLKISTGKDLIGIYQIGDIINSILDLRQLLNKIMDVAIETLDAERGLLILTDPETGGLNIEIVRGIEGENIEDAALISESIVKDVALTGNPLMTTDAGIDPRFQSRKSIIDYHITSVICVPLKIKNKIIGAIYLDHRRLTDLFDSENLSFLTTFANLAAVAIENARLHEKIQEENIYLRQEAEEKYKFENIVGKSKEMQKLYNVLERVIDVSTSVLLEGETGTGKEVIAKTIHYNSPRKDKRFIPVDCASIPPALFESELFGYLKGAFTGAISDKKGLFLEADEGTIFLDEVANIPSELQTKLLRVLQEGEIRKLGAEKSHKVNVRIIAAANKDLDKEVEKGNFRSDLYYRLNVITIKLPPLRDRKEDIPLLAHYFLDKYSKKLNKKCSGFTEEAMQILMDYDWPGNVRELEHLVERAITLTTKKQITGDLFFEKTVKKTTIPTLPEEKLKNAVETMEKEMIMKALKKYKHKTDAAKALGLSRFGLQKKIERYNLH